MSSARHVYVIVLNMPGDGHALLAVAERLKACRDHARAWGRRLNLDPSLRHDRATLRPWRGVTPTPIYSTLRPCHRRSGWVVQVADVQDACLVVLADSAELAAPHAAGYAARLGAASALTAARKLSFVRREGRA